MTTSRFLSRSLSVSVALAATVLETSADDFLTDAVRETTGTDIGFSNGFRFAPPIPAGPITEGDLGSSCPSTRA